MKAVQPSPLLDQVVPLPCSHQHTAKLSQLIDRATHSNSSCQSCEKEFYIVDTIIFAHLLLEPKGENNEERIARIQKTFGLEDCPRINFKYAEKKNSFNSCVNLFKNHISRSFWGDFNLFEGGAVAGSQKAAVQQFLAAKIGDARGEEATFEIYKNLVRAGEYAEPLDGESQENYHGRLQLFARRVVKLNSNDSDPIVRKLLSDLRLTITPKEVKIRPAILGVEEELGAKETRSRQRDAEARQEAIRLERNRQLRERIAENANPPPAPVRSWCERFCDAALPYFVLAAVLIFVVALVILDARVQQHRRY